MDKRGIMNQLILILAFSLVFVLSGCKQFSQFESGGDDPKEGTKEEKPEESPEKNKEPDESEDAGNPVNIPGVFLACNQEKEATSASEGESICGFYLEDKPAILAQAQDLGAEKFDIKASDDRVKVQALPPDDSRGHALLLYPLAVEKEKVILTGVVQGGTVNYKPVTKTFEEAQVGKKGGPTQ